MSAGLFLWDSFSSGLQMDRWWASSHEAEVGHQPYCWAAGRLGPASIKQGTWIQQRAFVLACDAPLGISWPQLHSWWGVGH